MDKTKKKAKKTKRKKENRSGLSVKITSFAQNNHSSLDEGKIVRSKIFNRAPQFSLRIKNEDSVQNS